MKFIFWKKMIKIISWYILFSTIWLKSHEDPVLKEVFQTKNIPRFPMLKGCIMYNLLVTFQSGVESQTEAQMQIWKRHICRSA